MEPLPQTCTAHLRTDSSTAPAAQSALETPTRREWLLFLANLLLMTAAIGLTVGFFVWRRDKPPNNPGGPLRDMGFPVLLWDFFAVTPGPMLAVWSLGNALRFVGKSIKARYGEPPPLSDESLTMISGRDKVIAAGYFIFVVGIAVYIATHPPHGGGGWVGFAALILLSLPFTFGMIPPFRKEVTRWVRWVVEQRRNGSAR